jgi:hypothetical protein
VPKLQKVIDEIDQEYIFPLDNMEATPSDEERIDHLEMVHILNTVGKQKVRTKKAEITVKDLQTHTAIHKRLRRGYNGDGGSQTRWVHPESLTP